MNALMTQEPTTVAQTLEELSSLDSAKLAERLREAMSLTVRGITVAAAAYKLLDERDAVPDGIGHSTRRMLLAVAENRMLPELAIDFAGRKRLTARAELLPIKEQRQLVDDQPVRVAVGDGDARMVRPSQMDDRMIKQVFAQDHIRDESEQRTWMQTNPVKTPAIAGAFSGIVINKRQGYIEIKQACRMTAGELLDWAKKLTDR